MKILLLLFLACLVGCARVRVSPPVNAAAPAVTAATAAPPTTSNLADSARPARSAEQIRATCIAGRRLICGRVLKVLPDGLVIESGYSDLLRPPLTESWLIPGTVSAHQDAAAIELNQPGTMCRGLIFLTDIPRRPKPGDFDYVLLMAYPAGNYAYSPAPNRTKTIRRFSAGLETAVRLSLPVEQ
jgi:hypothetical protein